MRPRRRRSVKSKSLETKKGDNDKEKEYPILERTETMNTNNDDTQSPPITLRISTFTSQGGRSYMEDQMGMSYVPAPDSDDLEKAAYLYAGVYDGHGGPEAAKYAKQHLISYIVQQKEFWENDDDKILEAIKLGYLSLQGAMMELQDKGIWAPTHKGHKSTSGSTASICIIKDGKLFIGHVGDSRVVLGRQKRGVGLSSPWMSEQLTIDHKPEDPEEEARILSDGGKVVLARGVHRVVWKRLKSTSALDDSPVEMEEIPFLAVARSLGDLWSYNAESKRFIVSPEPDVRMVKLDARDHRCVILASDGVWGMMDSRESVLYVQKAEILRAKAIKQSEGQHLPKSVLNPSQLIGREALKRWRGRKARADNISVITIILEDPCESRPSCIPVFGEPIDHAVDSIENIASEDEDLHSGDVSSSDGDAGLMDAEVNTDSVQAMTSSLELQEPDVTSSSNEVSKPSKRVPRTPSPDICAPYWSLEQKRMHSSAFQRYRRRTPCSGQGFSPTVMEIGGNGGTVSTPQRRRQSPNKKVKSPVRRRILNSFSDVTEKLKEAQMLRKFTEGMVHSPIKSRRTPKKSRGPARVQKKRKIQSMPMLVPASKKRKLPQRRSAPIAIEELPVLNLEVPTSNPFCRVTRSQMKRGGTSKQSL